MSKRLVPLACLAALFFPGAGHLDLKGGDAVLARVNGEDVMASEVDRELARVVGKRNVDDKARAAIRAQVLEQVIDRHLVHQWLIRTGRGATAAEIDQAAERIKRDLAERKREWGAYLKDQSLTDEEWRRESAWRIAWSRQVAERFDDAGLKKYFERRRRDFDGTQIRIRHLLLRGDEKRSPEATKKLIDRVAAIRQAIADGKISFNQAVRLHSQAPTKETGGDLGFITRHGEQVESFAKAAFALDKGQISSPVVTPFGVHLIQCVEITPGKKTLDDVREDLLKAATAELFRDQASAERKAVRIEYAK
jgi:parvulin-like peptidyl-prolyl isomerase